MTSRRSLINYFALKIEKITVHDSSFDYQTTPVLQIFQSNLVNLLSDQPRFQYQQYFRQLPTLCSSVSGGSHAECSNIFRPDAYSQMAKVTGER
jgi:hypothetical protein